jgi:dihydrofolate reductase
VPKLYSFMAVSADGYHADLGQAPGWQTLDEEFSRFSLEQLGETGTLVLGRATYELMAAYWPTPVGEEFSSAVAKVMNSIPKIVISRTLTQATWANTQVVNDHAAEELARLKRQPGKDIAIFGSSSLTAGLLPTGLVDELRIMVNPVVLGRGRSLFAGAPETGLKLLKTRQFTSGNILLHYRPVTP